ncbi:hypothetical protein ANCDUO_17269, partial [Ancylostoma duodenale]
VILTCKPTLNRCHALTSSISFEEKELAASFIRFIARNVSNWLTIDVEDYGEHSESDEFFSHTRETNAAIQLIKTWCPLGIDSIIFRRPQCFCPVCCALVDHAGPDVKIVELSEDGSDDDRESFTSGHASGDGDNSEEDDHDDLSLNEYDLVADPCLRALKIDQWLEQAENFLSPYLEKKVIVVTLIGKDSLNRAKGEDLNDFLRMDVFPRWTNEDDTMSIQAFYCVDTNVVYLLMNGYGDFVNLQQNFFERLAEAEEAEV